MNLLDLLSKVDPAAGLNLLVLLVLLGVGAKKLWPKLRDAVHLADKLQKLDKMADDVETVKGEVTYNDGKSLKDAVRRIEQGQVSNEARLDRIEQATFRGDTSV